MKIKEVSEDKQTLKIITDSNEESLFYLLKAYFESNSDVEIVGVYEGHHLIDTTEFYLKVKKGSPKTFLKKALAEVKKDLNSKKLK